MKRKEFMVIGLGRFGYSIAVALADSGCAVMAVDSCEERINDIADKVTHAVKADVTDVAVMSSLGVKNFDGVIISIGTNMETSIMATIFAKEQGAKYILAKAKSEVHARILKKVGADKVIQPEKETGIRMAHRLLYGNFFDAVELSNTFSIMETAAAPEWIGKSLRELDLRAKSKINVLAIKDGEGNVDPNPDPNSAIKENDILIVAGNNDKLQKLNIHR